MAVPPQIEAAVEKVDTFIAKYPTIFQYEKLEEIEKKTGYHKVYFFLLFTNCIIGTIFLLGGPKLATDLVSFVYPAYMSFKAIDSSNPTDDTQWLTYWVVFAFFSIMESVAIFITDMIPFYFFLKVAFFVWLYHPKFLGAGIVYGSVIKPIVLPHLEEMGLLVGPKAVEKKKE